MTKLSRSVRIATFSFLALGGGLFVNAAQAQFTGQNAPSDANKPQPSDPGSVDYHGKGEHLTARGRHSLPPGYQETPSTEFKHGPDPDHADHIQRDAVTGTDLSRFGNAYSSSSPVQSGQLGDATGNGWVAPR